jgi:hypothetical protein
MTEQSTPGPMQNDPANTGTIIPGITAPPWPNELAAFASFNCIMTLAMLAPQDLNDPLGPTGYRTKVPDTILVRSGGGIAPSKPMTDAETEFGIATEFFIDDLSMDTVLSPTGKTGATNATNISFTITEPYSMGQFIETIRVGAKQLGYPVHTSAVYVLMLEFVGYDNANNVGSGSYQNRFIPLKITDITFEVTEAGSVYNVSAVPYNESALSDTTQKLRSDISISGRTVSEILQSGLNSLMTEINNREIEKEDKGKVNLADQYVVMFPKPDKLGENPGLADGSTDGGATVVDSASGIQDDGVLYASIRGTTAADEDGDGVLEIPTDFISEFTQFKDAQTGKVKGRSTIGETIRAFSEDPANINQIGSQVITESWIDGGEHPFGKDSFAYDTVNQIYNRGSVELQLSDDLRKFKFKSAVRIQDVIEEVILTSGYSQLLLTQLKNLPADGMLNWFRIEPQVYIVEDAKTLKQIGEYPKVFVYRVIEYKVHHSYFKAPTSSSIVSHIKGQCAKQYNYIYTGKNEDVLDFKIDYQYAYLTNIPEDFGEGTKRKGATDKAVQPAAGEVNVSSDPDTTPPNFNDEGAPKISGSATQTTGNKGGLGDDKPETQIARSFHQAMLDGSTADMINCEMTVMGDPFWIADSGTGNYSAGNTSYDNMTPDGSVNYQNGQVHVNVLFRTPIDYDKDGLMRFPGTSSKVVGSFSGVFQVPEVKHEISQNKYTSTLKLIRVRGQTDGPATSLVRTGGPENSTQSDVPGSVYDDDRNIIQQSQETLDQILNLLPGGTVSQLAAAALDNARALIGGLDPLAATKESIAAALGIDINLIPADVDDILGGQWDPTDPDGDGIPGVSDLLDQVGGITDLLENPPELNADDLFT